MRDSRVEKLAELLTGYSLGLKEGQVFRVDGEEAALPLIVAAYRWAIRRGALAYAQARPAGLDEILLEEGNEEQLGLHLARRAIRDRGARRLAHALVVVEHACA